MKTAIVDTGFLLVGLGAGTLLANNRFGTSQINWTVLVIGFCLIAGAWLSGPIRTAATGRPIDDWEYVAFSKSMATYSQFPEKVFSESKREAFWEGLPQNDGDYYKLDLRRERLISAVQFYRGESNKVPNKWQMLLNNNSQEYVSPYKTSRPPHIEGFGPILAEFEKPIKARYVMVKITEPRAGVTWAIESIRIKENRLFGLRKVLIGELR